jgi:hypothetical protein
VQENERLEVRWRLWEQAWAQSRHVESMRSQYLGFYFVVAVATGGVVAKQLVDGGTDSEASALVWASAGVVLDVVTAFVLLAVLRFGEVLTAYSQTIWIILERAKKDACNKELICTLPRHSAARAGPLLRSAHDGVVGAMRVSLAGLPFLTALVLIELDGLDGAAAPICVGAVVLTFAVSAYGLWAASRYPPDGRHRAPAKAPAERG